MEFINIVMMLFKNNLRNTKEQIIGKTLYDLPHVIPKENADLYYEKDRELFDFKRTIL